MAASAIASGPAICGTSSHQASTEAACMGVWTASTRTSSRPPLAARLPAAPGHRARTARVCWGAGTERRTALRRRPARPEPRVRRPRPPSHRGEAPSRAEDAHRLLHGARGVLGEHQAVPADHGIELPVLREDVALIEDGDSSAGATVLVLEDTHDFEVADGTLGAASAGGTPKGRTVRAFNSHPQGGGPRNRTWRCGFGDHRVTDTPVPRGHRIVGATSSGATPAAGAAGFQSGGPAGTLS